MPFTPFHLGPGAVFKAAGGRHFSFMVFGGSQVLMDIEPLVGMLRGSSILHGYSHTIAGALAIGTVAGAIGKPVGKWVLELLRIPHYPFSWFASFLAAYVGTFSHILLDGIMHTDMRPWWPFTEDNGLPGIIPTGQLHLFCTILGVIGVVIITIKAFKRGKA